MEAKTSKEVTAKQLKGKVCCFVKEKLTKKEEHCLSNPRDDWWYNAVRMVRNYPARKKEYEELHKAGLSSPISGMPGSADVSRTTENIALRQLPPQKQREYEAVNRAIEITKLLPNGEKRMELIKKMYWSGKKLHIGQVIYQVGISEATGKRWHARFIKIVGECIGYSIS